MEATCREFGLLSVTQTRRTHLNKLWLQMGIRVLLENYEPSFRWLLDDEDSLIAGTGKIRRKVIISELGRIADSAEILATAHRICEDELSTHMAVVLIRQERIGHGAEPYLQGLTVALVRTYNRYLDVHPDISRDQIMDELETFVTRVTDALGERR
jgi:hypothetical protein